MSPSDLVAALFDILSLLILIRILLSWLPMVGIRLDPYNPIVQFLISITDPILEPFRRLIPPVSGIDFSPIIAILALSMVQQVLMAVLP